MRDPSCVVVTGASSGLGEVLALAYAAPGKLLALTGRNRERLDHVATSCRAKGAETIADIVDVRDAEAMATWLNEVNAYRPIDLVIANAGVSPGTSGMTEHSDQVRAIFEINLGGVVNTVQPAIELMKANPTSARPRGQIAIMASMAAYVGFPGAAAYSATKGAVRIWGEALRAELHGDGIEVTVIAPGYVRSRITDHNTYRMPMFMEADRAARIMMRGLARNKPVVAFPLPIYAAVRLLAMLPRRLTDPLFRRATR